MSDFGAPLTADELAAIAKAHYTAPDVARLAVFRVTNEQGRLIVNRNGTEDYAGLAFKYSLPGTNGATMHRLRRDNPPFEVSGGVRKIKDKYLCAAGWSNRLFFPPGTDPGVLADTNVPVWLTEGEWKTLALLRLANEAHGESDETPAPLCAGLAGVWGWCGKVGITTGPDGHRTQEKGPIPDLSLLSWDGRRVLIIFDVDVLSNQSVAAARNQLARELAGRGAEVYFVDLPQSDEVKGIDDFLAKHGPGPALELFRSARRFVPREELACLFNTDLGNEQAFELLYGDEFLYIATAKAWAKWNGVIWQLDELGSADRAMVEVAHARLQSVSTLPNGTPEEKDAKKVATKGALKLQAVNARQNALDSASTNPCFARRAEDFNKEHLLFACGNGVVELETGTFRKGRRDDMLTLSTPVYFVPEACADRWLAFLADIFPNRPEMIAFIKRAVGYSLTGLTREEVFFILHGRSGRNGKGTFLRILSAVLGAYATNTPFSTLIADRDQGKGPRNDIAALADKRFVTAQESNEGVRFDEALIKSLTGGDLCTARFLNKEFFTFAPTWKIWLSTNNPPEIRGTDGGVWSRPKLIPFTVSFLGRENRGLKDELLEPRQLSGVLRWAVEGAKEYLEKGLEYPEEVLRATEDYKAESNLAARFVAECCVRGDGFRAKARPLYQEFSRWAEGSGGMSETAFGRRLTEMGFQKHRTDRGNEYHGLAPMNAKKEAEPDGM